MFIGLINTLLLCLALPTFAESHRRSNGGFKRHSEVARRASGDVHLYKRFSNTKWTFYDVEVGLGACGKQNYDSDFTVALNSAQYGGGYPGPHCFQTITMKYNGKTAVATIMDECPGCPYGGLDLTRGLFSYFDSQDKGIIYGEWWFGSDGGDDTPTTTTKKTTTKQTSTWTPPTTTSTWEAPTTTSTSSKKKTSTTSETPTPTPTSSSVVTTSSKPATTSSLPESSITSSAPTETSTSSFTSASAAAFAGGSATPSETPSAASGNLYVLNSAFIQFSDVIVVAANVNA